MRKQDIRKIQSEIGVTPDGFFGPKSRAAAISFLRDLYPDNPFPKDNTVDIIKYYGDFGKEGSPERQAYLESLVRIDVRPLEVLYGGKKTKSIRCHPLLEESLTSIIYTLAKEYPEVLLEYNGSIEIRPMRNGRAPSRHGWCAVDFMASRNGLKTHWPMAAQMPWGVIKIFAEHGWMSGGAVWGFDAMHFQATSW